MTDHLKNRMHAFEETPPPGTWPFIAATLEEEAHAALADRLLRYETTPPLQAWEHIGTAITAKAPSPVKKLSTRGYYRALAVAAITIALFAGSWYAYTSLLPDRPSAQLPPVNVSMGTAVGPVSQSTINRLLQPQPASTIPKAINNTPLPLKKDVIKSSVVDELPMLSKELPITIAAVPIKDANGALIASNNASYDPTKYLTVTGPNGELTRISSKFADLVKYINNQNESPTHRKNAWEKQIAEWQNKIIQSGFIPAPANFLDIIEFEELLKENP